MGERLNLRASWDEVKERLKENDVSLTDDDLQYEPGREQELLDRLAQRSNKSTDEVRRYIESISANEDKAG
jgi:uncharacterized protein YjbJ (UPF0337 family)